MVKAKGEVQSLDNLLDDLGEFVQQINNKYGYDICLEMNFQEPSSWDNLTLSQIHKAIITVGMRRDPHLMPLMNFRTRQAVITPYKQCFFYLANQVAGYSTPSIGKYISKEHSTIIHAIKQFEDRIGKDKILTNVFNDVIQQLERTCGKYSKR